MSGRIDNHALRIMTLGEIITRLHDGADSEIVKPLPALTVRETDSTRIASMEQELSPQRGLRGERRLFEYDNLENGD
ncbi:DUF438 domain-containing protein [bacterium]|nr:DUF438 domain-containing protein [bacterium]